MALRALVIGKKLREAQKALEEARTKLTEMETREAELEADIDQAETEEEKAAYIRHALELIGCFFINCQDHLPLVPDIGNYLFANLTIKGDITFADSVVSIGRNAFRYFAGPKIIALPESITTIGNNAFYYATNLVVILQGEKQPSSLGSNWDYYCGHYVNPQQVITTEDAIYVIDQNGKAWLAKYCADESEFVAETVIEKVTDAKGSVVATVVVTKKKDSVAVKNTYMSHIFIKVALCINQAGNLFKLRLHKQ